MIAIYSMLMVFLGTLKALVGRKAARLERRYERVAQESERLLRETSLRPGNSNKPDAAQAAKQQFLLGQLVQKRDYLEAKQEAWVRTSEWLSKLLVSVWRWKGRTLPYLFGAIDLYVLLVILEAVGLSDAVRPTVVIEWLNSYFTP